MSFHSSVPSADFDRALNGGLAFSKGEFFSEEQKDAFVDAVIAALPVYGGEVKDV